MQDGTESIASLDPGADGVLPIGVIRFFWSGWQLKSPVVNPRVSPSTIFELASRRWAAIKVGRCPLGTTWPFMEGTRSQFILATPPLFSSAPQSNNAPAFARSTQNYYYYLHSVTPVTTPSC